jgi:light-regulated signal transduction histidine kinase (bacteriophytochrome)
MRAGETLDLSACEREPIDVPGSVQYGLLLVVDQAADVILQAAGDTGYPCS